MTVSIHITEEEKLFCRLEATVNPVIANSEQRGLARGKARTPALQIR
jgi:hypothetical protein